MSFDEGSYPDVIHIGHKLCPSVFKESATCGSVQYYCLSATWAWLQLRDCLTTLMHSLRIDQIILLVIPTCLRISLCSVERNYARSVSTKEACGTNEYFENCTFECPPEKTCANRLLHVFCADVEMPCIPQCICKAGYYRKVAGGECIPEAECGPAFLEPLFG
uniref:SFRICE_034537 n=1 Tax=Spodoptera frugiperda TaxID=7108 RepID=A0A2H1X268_SPOFR